MNTKHYDYITHSLSTNTIINDDDQQQHEDNNVNQIREPYKGVNEANDENNDNWGVTKDTNTDINHTLANTTSINLTFNDINTDYNYCKLIPSSPLIRKNSDSISYLSIIRYMKDNFDKSEVGSIMNAIDDDDDDDGNKQDDHDHDNDYDHHHDGDDNDHYNHYHNYDHHDYHHGHHNHDHHGYHHDHLQHLVKPNHFNTSSSLKRKFTQLSQYDNLPLTTTTYSRLSLHNPHKVNNTNNDSNITLPQVKKVKMTFNPIITSADQDHHYYSYSFNNSLRNLIPKASSLSDGGGRGGEGRGDHDGDLGSGNHTGKKDPYVNFGDLKTRIRQLKQGIKGYWHHQYHGNKGNHRNNDSLDSRNMTMFLDNIMTQGNLTTGNNDEEGNTRYLEDGDIEPILIIHTRSNKDDAIEIE